MNLSPAWRSGGVIIQAELHRVGGTGDEFTAGGSTVPIVAGLRRSRWDCGILPIRSSDGVTPDIMCGVWQYVKRKQASWVVIAPSVFFSTLHLNDCTALSVKLLVAEWYGAKWRWE